MARRKETSNAVRVLHHRYVKDPGRKVRLAEERVNAEIARTIHDLRREAQLTQKELADLVGTTQSVISRLEDDDYEGHSVSMLNRIAKALNQKVAVIMTGGAPGSNALRYTFRVAMQGLRRSRGRTVIELSRKSGIDPEEIVSMERLDGYRPSPRSLHRLSQIYKIPEERLAGLAGAFTEIPEQIKKSASRFAAQSESFATLTREEKKALDRFVQVLRGETEGT